MIIVYWVFSFLLVLFNIWTLYNVPIVVSGVRSLLKSRGKKTEASALPEERLPLVSIIVPVKNEEKVVGRLLKALLSLRYPRGRKEIIVVDDASADGTREICARYASENGEIRVLRRPASTTKAAALNFGVSQAKGEIIATFDADSFPEEDALLNAIRHFVDPEVAGVQGRVCSINAGENMLTRFLSFEGAVQYELYTRGKDNLRLFVGLAGTCQFVRRSVLEKIGGWDEKCLTEDYELSLRLVEGNYVTVYASDSRTWEESPFTIKSLVRQRARWYRGNIENAVRFGRLMRHFSLRRLDAEMTLAGTFVIMMCVVNYFMALWFFYTPPTLAMTVVAQATSVFTLVTLGIVGVALACVTRSFRLKSILWLPFIYAYWGFQSFIVMYALFQIVFRRPRSWAKTARSGLVTNKEINGRIGKS